jgi:hypothetical protein
MDAIAAARTMLDAAITIDDTANAAFDALANDPIAAVAAAQAILADASSTPRARAAAFNVILNASHYLDDSDGDGSDDDDDDDDDADPCDSSDTGSCSCSDADNADDSDADPSE